MTLRFNLRWNVEFEMNSVASLFYTLLTSILLQAKNIIDIHENHYIF